MGFMFFPSFYPFSYQPNRGGSEGKKNSLTSVFPKPIFLKKLSPEVDVVQVQLLSDFSCSTFVQFISKKK